MIFLLTFLVWALSWAFMILAIAAIPLLWQRKYDTKLNWPIHLCLFWCWIMGMMGMLATTKFNERSFDYTIRLVEDNTIAPKLGQSYSFLSKPALKRSFLKEYGDGTKIYFIGADAPRVR